MKIFAIVGAAGAGKTSLIERLLPRLHEMGLRVAMLKHVPADVDLDRPGKDTWRHREAGAREVMVVSPTRWALMHELRDEPEPGPEELLARFAPCDLVLAEGYRDAALPKLEVWRRANGKAPVHANDSSVEAVVTDDPCESAKPLFRCDDTEAIVGFILDRVGLRARC